MINLPLPPHRYDATHERERNRLLEQADAGKQPLSGVLTMLARMLGVAADTMPYFDSASSAAVSELTEAARAFLAAADAHEMRHLLGLEDSVPALPEPHPSYPDDLNFLLTLARDENGF